MTLFDTYAWVNCYFRAVSPRHTDYKLYPTINDHFPTHSMFYPASIQLLTRGYLEFVCLK